MVFGNMGEDCATGVAFTRNPSTGANEFYGEYLVNAQGEDVVAGIRTPQHLTIAGKKANSSNLPAMEEVMPEVLRRAARGPAVRSKTITATCRTSSSPSSAANCGCCRPAPASAPRRRR